jgi:hypothetical protein
MQGSPVNSFLRFFIGFMILISLSFGITFAVQKYAGSQDAARQEAAAAALMLQKEK